MHERPTEETTSLGYPPFVLNTAPYDVAVPGFVCFFLSSIVFIQVFSSQKHYLSFESICVFMQGIQTSELN